MRNRTRDFGGAQCTHGPGAMAATRRLVSGPRFSDRVPASTHQRRMRIQSNIHFTAIKVPVKEICIQGVINSEVVILRIRFREVNMSGYFSVIMHDVIASIANQIFRGNVEAPFK